MKGHSTREAAKKLGISFTSMNRYIAEKKIPVPPLIEIGSTSARLWTEKDIDRVRAILPKIANGRKTRYQKQKPEVRSQKSVSAKATAKAKPKTKKEPQPRAPQPQHAKTARAGGPVAVPHEQRRSKH